MNRILQFFTSDTPPVSLQERILSAFLAFIATLLCLFIGSFFFDITKEPVYIASLGATAVLMFAAPNSTFSQPWPVIGSHIVCALIGVFSFQMIPYFPFAAAFSIGAAILAMQLLRCLHPPGGAAALAFILGSSEIHELGYQYVLSPVLLNALMLLALCFLINNIVPGRSYPNKALPGRTSQEKELGLQASLYSQNDLEAALSEMDSYIDISRADLHRIYRLAVSHANQRRLGNVVCRDIMTTHVLTLEFATELEEAWDKLHEKNVKGAAVIDRFNRVIGVITLQDFVRHADLKSHKESHEKIKRFLKRTEGISSQKIEVIGEIMSSPPICMTEDTHIIHLVDVFADNHFHHLPILDEKKHLVGIITRSDLMRALAVLRS